MKTLKVCQSQNCIVCDAPITVGSYRCVKCRQLCADVFAESIDTKTHEGVEFGVVDIKSTCCNADVDTESRVTCSEKCHEEYVAALIDEFGETKKVTSTVTGKTHLVPTRVIIEQGLNHSDLEKHPVIEDKK